MDSLPRPNSARNILELIYAAQKDRAIQERVIEVLQDAVPHSANHPTHPEVVTKRNRIRELIAKQNRTVEDNRAITGIILDH